MCVIKGEEVSRPDVKLLPLWVHGFPKSGDFTKYIICGNIREICPVFFGNATHKRFHTQKLTEKKGHSRESVAERWMGRDCFEGKDSHVINRNDVTHLTSPTDGAAGTDNGCFYFDAAVIQSSEIRMFRVYFCHPQLAKYMMPHVSFDS
jgi:hypothetical protein